MYKTKKPYEKHLLICEIGKSNNNKNSSAAASSAPPQSSTSNSNNNNNTSDEFAAEIVKHVILDCPRLQTLRSSCGLDKSQGKDLWLNASVVEFLNLALAMIGIEPTSTKAQNSIAKQEAKRGIVKADRDAKVAVLDDLDNSTTALSAVRNAQHRDSTQESLGSARRSQGAHLESNNNIDSNNPAELSRNLDETLVLSVTAPTPGENDLELKSRIRGRNDEESKEHL